MSGVKSPGVGGAQGNPGVRWVAAVLCGIWLAVGATARGQTTSPRTPEVMTIASLTGKDTFDAYCAPCHGRNGGGHGPIGPTLRTPPADIRHLSATHGYFPRDRIVAFVTGSGRPITAHGTRDMPIWGLIFRSLDPSDARGKVRIQNVVEYVESLQR